jgi:hypothetical protein
MITKESYKNRSSTFTFVTHYSTMTYNIDKLRNGSNTQHEYGNTGPRIPLYNIIGNQKLSIIRQRVITSINERLKAAGGAPVVTLSCHQTEDHRREPGNVQARSSVKSCSRGSGENCRTINTRTNY